MWTQVSVRKSLRHYLRVCEHDKTRPIYYGRNSSDQFVEFVVHLNILAKTVQPPNITNTRPIKCGRNSRDQFVVYLIILAILPRLIGLNLKMT